MINLSKRDMYFITWGLQELIHYLIKSHPDEQYRDKAGELINIGPICKLLFRIEDISEDCEDMILGSKNHINYLNDKDKIMGK